MQEPVAIASSTATGHAAPGIASARLLPPGVASSVEVFVAAKNAEASAQAKVLADDGWTFVDAPPPDPALLAASPALLREREPELRAQLASAPLDKKHLANAVVIATEAREASTRVAAVEAIARMGSGDPQYALVSLMKKLPATDPARRVLVPRLRPASTADPFVVTMAALLDDAGVLPEERRQVAMTLSLLAAVEGGALPADVLESLSPAARALLASTTLLARTNAQTGTTGN